MKHKYLVSYCYYDYSSKEPVYGRCYHKSSKSMTMKDIEKIEKKLEKDNKKVWGSGVCIVITGFTKFGK